MIPSGEKLPVNYIAPEMLVKRGIMYSAFKADMWGLGILTFLLLTNKYIFNVNDIRTYIRSIRTCRFSHSLPSICSEASSWFVYGLLNREPNERPTASRAKYMHWLQMKPENINKRLCDLTYSGVLTNMPSLYVSLVS